MSDTLQALHEEHKSRRAKWFPAKKPVILTEIIAERERIAAQSALLDMEIAELEKKREQLEVLRADCPLGRPGIKQIVAFICRKHEISPNDFFGDRRDQTLVLHRHVTFWLVKQMTALSLTNIAKHMQRDHTTIIHGIRKIEALRAANPSFAAELDELLEVLNVGVDAHVEP